LEVLAWQCCASYQVGEGRMINTKKYSNDEVIDCDLTITKTGYGIRLGAKNDPGFYLEIDKLEAVQLRDFLLKEYPQ
jgi:hypothetical protein